MSWSERTTRLAEAIDTLQGLNLDGMTGHEFSDYLEELNRQLNRLDCTRHDVTGQFEISGRLLDAGYRSITQWHRDRVHMSTREAGRVASLSRSLSHMATLAKHWADGNVSAEAARCIAALRDDVTEDLFDRDEPWLADAAAGCDNHDLRTVCREWALRANPDGTDPAERDKDAHVSTTFGGGARVDANLDPIGGAIVKNAFDRIVDEFFEADWAEAKARLGREPKMDELGRTKAQRRHDAMVELAIRADSYKGPRPRPLVTIIAGLPAIAEGLAKLWNDVPLSPDQLADILGQDPDIQRFVYGSAEQPIRYNPKHRLFTGKLREAILTRDRRCTAAGCDQDTRRGAVDHIHPVSEGGETTPTNGRGACHPCNRTRPQRRFGGDPPPDPDGTDPP